MPLCVKHDLIDADVMKSQSLFDSTDSFRTVRCSYDGCCLSIIGMHISWEANVLLAPVLSGSANQETRIVNDVDDG